MFGAKWSGTTNGSKNCRKAKVQPDLRRRGGEVNDFENFFREFVRDFGGEFVAEGDEKSADFVFRQDNVIAELKTLQKDARLEHAEKVQQLANDWMRRGLVLLYGRPRISLRALPPVCQKEWLQVLIPPVENIIRKANQQIRSSKDALSLPQASGLLLIANDGNFLHTEPADYLNIVALVLKKKDSNGKPKFPHIDGIVYFSYRVASSNEPFPFWAPAHVHPDDTEVISFQEKLRAGWFSYVARVNGIPVYGVSRKIE